MKAWTHTLRVALIALTMLAGGAPAFAISAAPMLETQTDDVARACLDRYGRLVPCRRMSLV